MCVSDVNTRRRCNTVRYIFPPSLCLRRKGDLCGHKTRSDILDSMNDKHTKMKRVKRFGHAIKLDESMGDSDILESNAESR